MRGMAADCRAVRHASSDTPILMLCLTQCSSQSSRHGLLVGNIRSGKTPQVVRNNNKQRPNQCCTCTAVRATFDRDINPRVVITFFFKNSCS